MASERKQIHAGGPEIQIWTRFGPWPVRIEEAESRSHIAALARAIHADDMIEMQFAIELSALTRPGRSR